MIEEDEIKGHVWTLGMVVAVWILARSAVKSGTKAAIKAASKATLNVKLLS